MIPSPPVPLHLDLGDLQVKSLHNIQFENELEEY